MERLLRPSRFDVDHNSAQAAKEWTHWLRTFTNIVEAVQLTTPTLDKLVLLTNYVAPSVYDYISECETYEKAEEVLTSLYVKPNNEIFARHPLATCRQNSSESLDQFLQALKLLAKDCQFKGVTAEEACDSYVRDAFINGLVSGTIRQRLLENLTLNLNTAYEQARTLEMAQKCSASYSSAEPVNAAVSAMSREEESFSAENKSVSVSAATSSARCFFFVGTTGIPELSVLLRTQCNLTPDCRPVANKSRIYSLSDKKFFEAEIERMMSEGIIRPSNSPWRAQVLVTSGENQKRRMVVDYSRTINKFTELDAYPLPNIDEMVNNIERWGVKNGVAAFQRVLDEILKKEKVGGTFAYVDNVTVCGETEEEYDQNLRRFLKVAEEYKLTLNHSKCDFKVRIIKLLGYSVTDGEIKPDPELLQPLWNLSLPKDAASLRMTMGLLAHYSRWIPNFSEKIHPLTQANGFHLSTEALQALGNLKKDIASAVVTAIDPTSLFTVETDASGHAIAATLTQNNRPVAFFSRTLTRSEQGHTAVEKEAYAIVEALRKWRHYLIGHHFKLTTDQRTENIPADALSRICGATTSDKLRELHEILCHPGISPMMHFVRGRNLPYSVEEVKKITTSSQVCLELKPRFFKYSGQLIKASLPFERLNLDFKGPVPSRSRNKYFLMVVDEFSRFPFVFPCADMTTRTVISCVVQLFALFGMPVYIHTDRGASFMSEELKDFLMKKGVATSRTTPYNLKGMVRLKNIMELYGKL
ncbi:uncharacterized protein [Palaemon carinicauda]|uniref:uncharacterized protein n=1 Tax=Palaemon carinicauda TaxID=392227 RepID=UPI0035B576D0